MAASVGSELSPAQRGDFQTPPELASKIWLSLDLSTTDLVIEPTFGLGSFITTMPRGCKVKIIGWEIHSEYYRTTIENPAIRELDPPPVLLRGDIFKVTPDELNLQPDASVLIIGNPPWITNSEQGTLGRENTGEKRNLKTLKGLDAVTGKSNFDISEGIIIHLVNLLKKRCGFAQFALLTKFSVLRNLVQYFNDDPNVGNFEFHRINAGTYFGASVEAGLLKFQVGEGLRLRSTCQVFSPVGGEKVGEIGIINSRLIYDLPTYSRTSFMESNGQPCYVWRQGVKHDLRNVLELTERDGGLKNRLGEDVDVEPETLHRLFKSSDIFHGRESRFVIPIYQRNLKESLEDLGSRFPKLYAYLQSHAIEFSARKSSIYKKRPAFTMFGIGDYTHATYKVAIGGLYSTPVFRLLQPNPRPAVVDDTGYMLATDDFTEGVYLLAVLTLDCTRDFLLSISHASDKRRFSKDVLARVLIPPMRDCPESIIRSLIDSWSKTNTFTRAASRRLHQWLSAYGGKGDLSFES